MADEAHEACHSACHEAHEAHNQIIVIKSMRWIPREFGTICPSCNTEQPIERQCAKCKNTRRFSCFLNETTNETFCHREEDWEEWNNCRYCSDDFSKHGEWYDEMQENEKTNDYVEFLNILVHKYGAWTTQECKKCNVEDRHKMYICYLCGGGERMVPCVDGCQLKQNYGQTDCNWFCDPCKLKHGIFWKKLENYCYRCKFPQPLAKHCRTCGESYRFSCFYPHQCIGMFYPELTDNVKYNTCPNCLIKRRMEDQLSHFSSNDY